MGLPCFWRPAVCGREKPQGATEEGTLPSQLPSHGVPASLAPSATSLPRGREGARPRETPGEGPPSPTCFGSLDSPDTHGALKPVPVSALRSREESSPSASLSVCAHTPPFPAPLGAGCGCHPLPLWVPPSCVLGTRLRGLTSTELSLRDTGTCTSALRGLGGGRRDGPGHARPAGDSGGQRGAEGEGGLSSASFIYQ